MTDTRKEKQFNAKNVLQFVLAGLVLAYLAAIPLGFVKPEVRLSWLEIAAVGFLLLLFSDEWERVASFSVGDRGITAEFREIAKRQADQHEEIRTLQFVVEKIVTEYEVDKLIGLENDEPFMCHYSSDLDHEIKRLRALDFVTHNEGTGLTDMRRRHKDQPEKFDLHRYFRITREGREYLTLRRVDSDESLTE